MTQFYQDRPHFYYFKTHYTIRKSGFERRTGTKRRPSQPDLLGNDSSVNDTRGQNIDEQAGECLLAQGRNSRLSKSSAEKS